MGTNYYLEREVCPTCGHAKGYFHIGKSSYGWTFTFHGFRGPYDFEEIGQPILSYKDWLEVLPSGIIKDEYGDEISLEKFKELVEEKKNAKKNHTIYCRKSCPEHAKRDCWLDEDGNSFSSGEFS